MQLGELSVVRLVGGPYDGQELRVAPGEVEKRLLVDLQLFEASDEVIDAAQRGAHPATNQGELYLWLNEQIARKHRDLRAGASKPKTAIYRISSVAKQFDFAGYVRDAESNDS